MNEFAKRVFDILTSLCALALLSPLFLVIALVIKTKMPGPVFFCQERAGLHGKPFTIYKFRTMTLNNGGNTLSVKGESRITPVGGLLRKYKLDELPELWNVLRGDMSVVGPRPNMMVYAERLNGEEQLILEIRPGITCPASIKYMNEEELLASTIDPLRYHDEIIWPDKVRLNLDYYHTRNLKGDLLIIIKTILRARES